jgi:hypothetical protein
MPPSRAPITRPATVRALVRRLRRPLDRGPFPGEDLRRPVPLGLIGMLALVAAIEMVVAGRPLDYSDPVSLSWRLAATAARDEAPGWRVLCVGDSLVKHAVVPAVVAAGTGRRAGNLGIARGPVPATYFLLRRALEAGARPEAVVLDVKPGVLAGSPRYNLRYWQEIASPREALELARASGGGSLLVEIVLGRLLPTFRARHEVRGHLLAALRGEPSPLRLINSTCRRNWLVNGGANVAARNPTFTGAVSPEQFKTLLADAWRCHRVNALYVRRILDLASARGIRVYWLLPPLSPRLQERRERTGAEEGYLRFVRSMQERHPELTVVDGRHAGYDHTAFVDATHLDGQGGAILSSDLAALLARDLSAPPAPGRWVDLPPFRPRPTDVPLEDVEQSRRVVLASPERAVR